MTILASYCIKNQMKNSTENSEKAQKQDLRTEAGFLKIYDQYSAKLFRFVYYKVRGHKHDAEQLTQETFMRAWKYLSTHGEEIENIKAFLYRIARNAVVDHWRRQLRHAEVELEPELIENTLPDEEWQRRLEAKIDVEILKKSLNKLPDGYREVLTMRYLDEMAVKEIAEVIDKTENNTSVLLHRATKAAQNTILKL